MVESFNPDGRPRKYEGDKTDTQVYKYALLGLTDKEMANLLDITVSTFNKWKTDFPTFSESINDGKDKADAEVASKLHQRAIGVEWEEEQAIKVKRGINNEEIEKIKVKKRLPPDVGAINSWLSNRQRKRWKNRQDVEHSGDEENPVAIDVVPDLSKISDEQLERAIRIKSKSITGDSSGA